MTGLWDRDTAYVAELWADGDDLPLADLPVIDGRGFDPTRVRLTGLRPAEWQTEALCAGQASGDLDPWHPEDAPAGERQTLRELAVEGCLACPVRLQCLAYGLALLPLGDVHGIYAGFTFLELRRIARVRGMAHRLTAQHGTRGSYVEGCRCADCLRAHNVYYVEKRRKESYLRPALAAS